MNIKRVSCFKIETWDDFSLCLRLFANGWLFRGHGNAEWNLATALDRKKYAVESEAEIFLNQYDGITKQLNSIFPKYIKAKEEYAAIQTYHRLSFLPKEMKKIEVLAHMQHYGAATRLLDVTTSFLIALFFAFEEYGTQDRAVWAFNKKLFYDRSFVVTKVAESTFDTPEANIIAYNRLMSNRENLYNKMLDAAEKCIKQNDSYEQQKLSILPLEIVGNNSRLIAQNGAFLFPTTLQSFEEHLLHVLEMTKEDYSQATNTISNLQQEVEEKNLPHSYVLKLIFPVEARNFANKLFLEANISAKSIYPDQVGLAKSIKYW